MRAFVRSYVRACVCMTKCTLTALLTLWCSLTTTAVVQFACQQLQCLADSHICCNIGSEPSHSLHYSNTATRGRAMCLLVPEGTAGRDSRYSFQNYPCEGRTVPVLCCFFNSLLQRWVNLHRVSLQSSLLFANAPPDLHTLF